MKCTKIRALLSAYADRELTGVEMFLVRQHLHECSSCRAEETEMRDVKHALGSIHVAEPSSDFQVRLRLSVMAGVPSPTSVSLRPDRSSLYAIISVAAAAAAAMLLFGGQSKSSEAGLPLLPSTSQSAIVTAPKPQNIKMSLQRDRAFMTSDPLTGPQLAVAASYAR